MPGTPTLQEILTQRLKEVRIERGLRQDDLARRMGSYGFNWSAATVAALETNRRNLSLEETLILPYVLHVDLAQLMDAPFAEKVVINDRGAIRLEALRGAVLGLTFQVPEEISRPLFSLDRPAIDEDVVLAMKETRSADQGVTALWIDSVRKQEAERKAARSLGISAAEVAAWSLYLWGQSLTEEREKRVAETEEVALSEQALRGHVTRSLLKEIKAAREAKDEIPEGWSRELPGLDLPEEPLNERLRSISVEDFRKVLEEVEEYAAEREKREKKEEQS